MSSVPEEETQWKFPLCHHFSTINSIRYQWSQASIQLYFFQHLHLPPTKTTSPSLPSKPSLIAGSFFWGKLKYVKKKKKSLTLSTRDNQN